eukprot:3008895-Rhodomonas_salina.4
MQSVRGRGRVRSVSDVVQVRGHATSDTGGRHGQRQPQSPALHAGTRPSLAAYIYVLVLACLAHNKMQKTNKKKTQQQQQQQPKNKKKLCGCFCSCACEISGWCPDQRRTFMASLSGWRGVEGLGGAVTQDADGWRAGEGTRRR